MPGVFVQVLGADVAKGRRVMVFCNTLDSCRATEHYLREKDIHTCCYHGDIPLDGRREAIQEFTGDAGMDGQPVLVCTDLAARYRPCSKQHCSSGQCTVHVMRILSAARPITMCTVSTDQPLRWPVFVTLQKTGGSIELPVLYRI